MLFKNVRKGKQGKRVTMSKDALRILIKEIADQAPSISSESVIYCDMDGVLVDFETGTVELLNSILDGDDVKWVTRDGKSIQKALRRLHRELGTEWRAVGRTDLDIKPVRNFMFAVVKDSPGIFYGSLPQLKDSIPRLSIILFPLVLTLSLIQRFSLANQYFFV